MFIRRRDTMHLRNKTVVGVVSGSLLFAGFFVRSQQALRAQDQGKASQQKIQATPLPADVDPNDPAVPVWMRTAGPRASSTPPPTPANVPPPGQQPAQQPAQPSQQGRAGEVTKSGGIFTIRVQSDEVTLQATVIDQKHHLVTTLAPANFVIYEDGQPQPITSFKREDIPVSIGIVVDNSGSMRTKRNAVTKAVLNLVQASNPKDEVFIVNFNDEPYLDQDFTNNVSLMREAPDRVDSRSGTALSDAVVASAEHLATGAQRERPRLLGITGGDDNESRESLEQAIRAVQNENGPTIYTIGILGEEGNTKRFKRALEALSLQTGGVAFFPKNLEEVDEMSQAVAHDIRNQYTITYKPTNPRTNGGYRAVRVVAHAPGYKELQVRTRSGYFATDQKTTNR